jgi:hypothetical protein
MDVNKLKDNIARQVVILKDRHEGIHHIKDNLEILKKWINSEKGIAELDLILEGLYYINQLELEQLALVQDIWKEVK